ncbi:tRNA pseudouridine(55) synthase TruB [Intestinimonas butyriciproducens]|uniref:tRNA pseudouridine(55) synthase TruB n=1 Tax=Intestinimonas butyriciproducens TaxID=1297617 RepID=UPI000821D554|nr:tRNA pseudouridine(55) synthase TruB [Intestinimonas butyriciproducens]SCJ80905.1 tRNA pseudouridine synthase B [uncultured Clostridium sp.]MBU5228430.1 tRNA pseudouridine(55) synthase TruB [Intestinimonas butyriciproducens]MCI6364604.1 tRNA pseudouridine(55) synthase TruB [Intestinimonas butyriciproducens]MDB7829953.1 tRNA pseudouridine(55) synthase TruB [Intestinimonas butyriciproducens]MDB7861578.1 tRNA pseudouridine(55) synthase TruB [Intestinimonas butyriciproducens]
MPNGIIIIDKPAGWTSMDVCAKLRGIFHEKRVGHAGTLDPMATGVLPVFLGRATRAVEFAEQTGKEYLAGLRLGLVTDTQDVTGRVLEERPVTCAPAEVEAALAAFRGEILQVPPMYSAVKIGGKKLYELARKGREVERKPRPVTIHALEVLERTGAGDYLLRVRCSKGTYVRTLCHDVGAALGCGGTLSALRRTEAAGFGLDRAVRLEDVQAAADRGEAERLLLPVDAYFQDHPALTVGLREERAARNGAAFPWRGADGTYRVYGPAGDFLLLGELERGRMRTVKSFYEV